MADPRIGRAARIRTGPEFMDLGGGVSRDVNCVGPPHPAQVAQCARLRADVTISRSTPGFHGCARLLRYVFDRRGHGRGARDAVRNGSLVGGLAGRDSASVAGLDYAGPYARDGLGVPGAMVRYDQRWAGTGPPNRPRSTR